MIEEMAHGQPVWDQTNDERHLHDKPSGKVMKVDEFHSVQRARKLAQHLDRQRSQRVEENIHDHDAPYFFCFIC